MLVRDCREKNPDRWVIGSQLEVDPDSDSERNRDGGSRDPTIWPEKPLGFVLDMLDPANRIVGQHRGELADRHLLQLATTVYCFVFFYLVPSGVSEFKNRPCLTTIFPRSRAQKLALFFCLYITRT